MMNSPADSSSSPLEMEVLCSTSPRAQVSDCSQPSDEFSSSEERSSSPKIMCIENIYLSRESTRSKLKRMQQEIDMLDEQVRSLRKKMKKMEQMFEEKEKATVQPTLEEDSTHLGSHLATLRGCVSHLKPENIKECLKYLSYAIFSKDELITCSVSGKKSIKSGETPRPPLDQDRLQILEMLVREKCDIPHKLFVEKLQNIQKVLRRGSKTNFTTKWHS